MQLFDLVAVALAIALPPATQPSPFRGVRAAYLTVAILSILAAQNPIYASFTLWKLLVVVIRRPPGRARGSG